MIPGKFEYLVPQTLDEAVFLLTKNPEAKILSGGQSLIPLMKLRFASPPCLIDINRIPDLDYIREADGSLRIGALVRESDVEKSEIIRKKYPILFDTAQVIADPLVRNRATLCGNVAHADPANDHPATMIALNAQFVAKGPNGQRTIQAQDFFTGLFTTDLQPDEILTEIRVPAPPERSGGAYLKLERKVGDFAIAAVAAQLTLDEKGTCSYVGIALTNAGLTPVKATKAEQFLLGKKPDEKNINEAAKLAAEDAEPRADFRGPAVLSSDGSKIVLVARDSSGKDLLWIRSMDSLTLQPLAGTENPSYPFWSPDGDSIGFFAGGKLKKIAVSGGPAQILCDAPIGRGGSWSREGVILFATTGTPLSRVSVSGGPVTFVTQLNTERGEDSHRWPFFLPDGKHFLYVMTSFGTGGQKENMGIYVGNLDSKEEKFLIQANSSVAYAPSGHLLFYRDGNLLAQLFDVKSLSLSGDVFPVVEDIQYFPQTYSVLCSISQNGSLIYQNRNFSGSQLTWFDRTGKSLGSLGPPADYANPQISPDGRKVAVDMTDPKTGNTDVWIYDSSGGIPTRFTSGPAEDTNPIWSPDGKSIIFGANPKTYRELFRKETSGIHAEERVLHFSENSGRITTDWSSNGQYILIRILDAGRNLELWTFQMDRKKEAPVPFLTSKFGQTHGQFSPDGRWVAYASNESGKWEVYVTPFVKSDTNWRVSSAGGSEPRWRQDGKELFYIAPNGWLMAVPVIQGPTFEAGEAVPLFLTHTRAHLSSTDLFSYDVSADGQRFLINTKSVEAQTPPLTVVLNWTARVKP